MCGIVFKHNYDKKKPVNNDILQQYDKQHHRGQRGFGVFDGQYMNIVREANEDNILKWLVKKNSNLILFHHRLPTSTVNVAKAAHPFSTRKYFGKVEYILAHNGIIRNADELWAAHQQLGIRYSSLLEDLSFNDSEALMWDIALTLEGKQTEMKAYGDMAFIIMKKINGKLVSMLYGRNTRPLNIRRTTESIELSSEGAGVGILSNMLYEFSFKTHVATKKEMDFPQYRTVTHWNHRPQETGTYPNSGFRTPEQQQLLPAGSAHAVHDADDNYSDYDSYDAWYAARHDMGTKPAGAPTVPQTHQEKVESKWQALRAKYGKKPIIVTDDTVTQAIAEVLESRELDSASAKSIGMILDAKRDKSGKFIVSEVDHKDMAINVDDLDMRDYSPTSSEIQTCAMAYMIEAQGNFENAYALLELEYAEFQDSVSGKETFDDIRQTLLFEAAMVFINSDPEYENEQSVSSIWQALWFQKSIATA